MAQILRNDLFNWDELQALGDLERLRLLLDYFPDEELIKDLERARGRGRNDYPIRPTWNLLLAGIVFGHPSIESLRREAQRNGQLRQLCGFDLGQGVQAVPTAAAYSHFLDLLIKRQDLVTKIFDRLVEDLRKVLPDFGKDLAGDGKALPSHAQPSKEKAKDRRGDPDANIGRKVYHGKRADGSPYEIIKEWFGYKAHLIVDARYELPVAFQVTKASAGELPVMEATFDRLKEKHPELVANCENVMGDKGYDSQAWINKLHLENGINPIIDIRNMWKDGEKTKAAPGSRNVVYNYKGDVFCVVPKYEGQTPDNIMRRMAFGGFEADRETLKYLCPALHYGCECAGRESCPVKHSARIKLDTDRRIFTPVARSSYKWARLYNKRTAVERVNSRLDVSFGFEEHFIRGLAKMELRCGLALAVMLGMALGRVKEQQISKIRSLVQAVAPDQEPTRRGKNRRLKAAG